MRRRVRAVAILVLGITLLAPAAPAQAPGDTAEGRMVEVGIDLQDGFNDDTVVISHERRELVREQDVNTRFQIGKARSLEVALPEGEVRLTVEVLTQDLSKTVLLDTSGPVFVGVSITPERELEVKVQSTPFGYL
jgi:hypothetical protein